MTKKNVFGVVVCAACLLGASAALGGEITGNAKWIAGGPDAPLNGKSACAFSGQNDERQLGDAAAPRTQSWGQIPKMVRDIITALGGSPGVACNPTKAPPTPP
jgi:hypothetical protein